MGKSARKKTSATQTRSGPYTVYPDRDVKLQNLNVDVPVIVLKQAERIRSCFKAHAAAARAGQGRPGPGY